jgi:hypothetical protein
MISNNKYEDFIKMCLFDIIYSFTLNNKTKTTRIIVSFNQDVISGIIILWRKTVKEILNLKFS